MNKFFQPFIQLTILLLIFSPVLAQDRSDILIVGHDAPGQGPNPEQIRADRDGNILWRKPLPLLIWGSDMNRHGDRNQKEDAFYLTSVDVSDQVGGKNRLMKLDANGNIVWDIPFSTAPIWISANPVDGGLYALERPPENKLHKLDGDGNVVWTLNGLTAVGLSTNPISGGVYISRQPNDVLKLAADGTEIWAKTLSAGVAGVNANPADGGVYVSWGPFAQRYTHRLDADGNIVWTKYGYPSNWNYGRSVSPLDGSLFIGSGWPGRIAHVAPDGAVLFNIASCTSYLPYISAAIDEMAAYTGDYAQCGVAKYDGSGNLLWRKFYHQPSWIGSYGHMHVYTGMPAVADFSKSIVSGNDLGGVEDDPPTPPDGEWDLAVEVGLEDPAAYEFRINYLQPELPPVQIEDTIPAEWKATILEDTLNCDVAQANKGKKDGKSATKLVCSPETTEGMVIVGADARCHDNRKNTLCRPTSCGALYLNNGAAAYELDPATGEPMRDEFGERLPPLAESNSLCLVAVYDMDESGSIDYTGNGDEDGDGLLDHNEACDIGTDPCAVDTDLDGVSDFDEVSTGCMNPLNGDTDGDTLGDFEELNGITDPCDPDSDDDGVADNEDSCPLEGIDPQLGEILMENGCVRQSECSDGIDNDSDGPIDFAGGDQSCDDILDDSEDTPDAVSE